MMNMNNWFPGAVSPPLRQSTAALLEERIQANRAVKAASPFHSVEFHYPSDAYHSQHATKGHYDTLKSSIDDNDPNVSSPSLDLTTLAANFDGDITEFALALPHLRFWSALQNPNKEPKKVITIRGLVSGGLVVSYRDGTIQRFCYCRKSRPIDAPPFFINMKENAALGAKQLHSLRTLPPIYIWNDGGVYTMEESQQQHEQQQQATKKEV